MVAVTLALIVSAGILGVFVGARSSFQATSGTASLADGGRFALDFIQTSVRSAGYMACNTSTRQLSLLNAGPTSIYYNFTQALGGYEANNTQPTNSYTVTSAPVTADTSTADWVGGLDAALSSLVVKNNDVLVVYSTLRNAQSVYVTAISDGASNFTVQNQGSLQGNQLAVISDCAKSAVMWITSVTGSSPSVTVNHATGGSPGNATAAFPVSFAVGSQVTPVDTTVFYIGKGADGDGALFAYDLNGGNAFTANELVPDIEAMQVLYGVDTNGSQTVADYVSADQVAVLSPANKFNSVISVKVAVLAASPPGAVPKPSAARTFSLLGTTVTAPIDTRARQVYAITIGVRNMAP
jgi:type IV pilus assembly protein PilW